MEERILGKVNLLPKMSVLEIIQRVVCLSRRD